MDYVIYVII